MPNDVLSTPWVQLILQVPLVAAFIFFVLENNKHEARERVERNALLLSDMQQRDEQWRQFLTQRDEQWVQTLKNIQDTNTLTYGAVIKQLDSCDARMDAIQLDLRTANVRFVQLEKTLLMSLDQMHVSAGKRKVTGPLHEGNSPAEGKR